MSAIDDMAAVLPVTAGVNGRGHLTLAGCDVVDLAAEFGTPLYVFDEATLRGAPCVHVPDQPNRRAKRDRYLSMAARVGAQPVR